MNTENNNMYGGGNRGFEPVSYTPNVARPAQDFPEPTADNPAPRIRPTAPVTSAPFNEPAPSFAPMPENRCPNCQALINGDLAYCPECGATLKSLCPMCGTKMPAGQSFCSACGYRNNAPGGYGTTPGVNPAINTYNASVAAPKKNNTALFIIIGIVAVIAVVIIIVALSGSSGSREKRFSFSDEFSYLSGESYCDIASDGSYMSIDTNPYDQEDYYDSEAVSAVPEINEKLGFSESVYQKMLQTRSLDGRVSDENENFRVSWTYHPDSGLEVMYEKK
ncbi:MAG: zinc ribbon domain-containing protein [Clostridia bacterium]|nr:zinc ribbon domain-containing protein [Clostridia bacterium]